MAKFEGMVKGDFNEIVKDLNRYILESAVSMNLVDSSESVGDMKVAVYVYDKYFMRNSSRACLSVTLVGTDEEIYVTAIGAGGGQGIFFNYSLGAEDDLVELVESYFREM